MSLELYAALIAGPSLALIFTVREYASAPPAATFKGCPKSIRSAATTLGDIQASGLYKRSIENETAWNGVSWMVEELLRRSEGFRLQSFKAGQQFQRPAYSDVFVGKKDDWCALQHGRPPFHGQVCAPKLLLHCAQLTDDAPLLEEFYNDNLMGINEMRIVLHLTGLANIGRCVRHRSIPLSNGLTLLA
jgi:hypothetical protein